MIAARLVRIYLVDGGVFAKLQCLFTAGQGYEIEVNTTNTC